MSIYASPQDLLNARTYYRADVARSYLDEKLTRLEVMTLLRCQPAIVRKDILDIGVGTGRTSIYLAPLASTYQGIDYSPSMVRHMQANRPGIPVQLADMRDLGAFADRRFDFVFAPSNVLDAVGHEDRLRTLAEFLRVLRPGGTLAFSSHNRHYAHAMNGPHLRWTPYDPIRQMRGVGIWVRQLANHRRFKSMRSSNGDYVLLNDEGHDFALLHYYIGQAEERRQLVCNGFEVIDVLDAQGTALAPDNQSPGSASLMYLARRKSD